MPDPSPTRIVHARPPQPRRKPTTAPTIVGPPPRFLEPDAETLRRADRSGEVWRELVRRAVGISDTQ